MQRLLIAFVTLAIFTAYSIVVAIEHGPLGFVDVATGGGWSTQVMLDLALSVLGFYVLAVPDAKRHGISAWPYLFASVALGSIGTLAYFVHRELRALGQARQ